ncbi:MAG: uracil-DNA glycosylase [Phycisphaerae bacterium]|nr:uracil-DNA glycosylase [Phycisphaerae bacterium]
MVDVDLASASASEPEAEVVPAAAVGIPIQEAMLDVAGLRSRTDRDAALETLRALHAAECPHCTTATAHTNLVFGEGSSEALLMFVGEAPGEVEDQLGRPFVGPAGQKLDEMIKAIGFQRSDVYIANVLKSRPPGNRTPLQHEVDACGRYLVEQIRIIAPRVIVTLGGPATKLLLGTELGITRLRGIWARFVRPGIALDVMPTFHPAYLLRNYTAETRRQVWSDLQSALTRVREQA